MGLFMDVHTIDGGVSATDDAESATTVHREAHGLVTDEIFAVSEHE